MTRPSFTVTITADDGLTELDVRVWAEASDRAGASGDGAVSRPMTGAGCTPPGEAGAAGGRLTFDGDGFILMVPAGVTTCTVKGKVERARKTPFCLAGWVSARQRQALSHPAG